MSPFEILMAEHRNIERGLDLLGRAVTRVEAGESPASSPLGPALADLVRFFRRYADACHHAKEEKVLFPALADVGLPPDEGPVAVMLAEHEEGRGLVGRIAQELGAPSPDSALLAQAARTFAALLSAHIRKEDQVLFHVGRMRLPPAQDAAILDAYANMEAAEVPSEEKAALLASLDRVEALLATPPNS